MFCAPPRLGRRRNRCGSSDAPDEQSLRCRYRSGRHSLRLANGCAIRQSFRQCHFAPPQCAHRGCDGDGHCVGWAAHAWPSAYDRRPPHLPQAHLPALWRDCPICPLRAEFEWRHLRPTRRDPPNHSHDIPIDANRSRQWARPNVRRYNRQYHTCVYAPWQQGVDGLALCP